jgi:transposase
VWVPDAAHEALRDLVRAREAAQQDQLRARHRLGKFLLRHGIRRPDRMTAWTRHRAWLATLHFPAPAQKATRLDYLHEVDRAAARLTRLEQALAAAPAHFQRLIAALQTLRGVKQVTAATIVSAVGPLTRFPRPTQLMAYSGTVPREHSSGGSIRRGAITKTGNGRLRRVLVEAAWAYRRGLSCPGALRQRQQGAVPGGPSHRQHRLCQRYRRLTGRGKLKPQVVTAIARELLGFIWAIGQEVTAAA